jgi:hypothetical protein
VFTYLIGLSRLNDGPSQPEPFVHCRYLDSSPRAFRYFLAVRL